MINGFCFGTRLINFKQQQVKMKTRLLSLAFICGAFNLFAQTHEEHPYPGEHLTCKTNDLSDEYARKLGIDPTNGPEAREYENFIQDFIRNNEGTRSERGVVYIIPIVFHVVHIGGPENISDAQIFDQLNILNRDYRKLNADTSVVVSAFSGIVADCEIEFRLAQKDALGNCVSGINRIFSSTTNLGDRSMVDAVNSYLNGGTSTTNIRYPRNKYLNIWVCKYADGAAGYTSLPAAWVPSKYDGIWIQYNYVGSIGASSLTTSRALTHEVGHWLNLRHVWGNTNNPGVSCGDDLVTDTPETEGWTSCNLSGATCGSPIDNVQNYMEYSYCSRMFTEGQKARMRAALNSSTASRNNLWTSANLAAAGVDGTPTLCQADFTSNQIIICQGDSIEFTDASYHTANAWNWTFASGTPATSTDQNPVVTYNTQGTFDVSLTASNASGTQSEIKTNYITVIDPVGAPIPYSEGFESVSSLPTSDLFLTDTDGMNAWEVISGYGASGSKCIKLDNYNFNESGGKDALVSKTFDLSTVSAAQLTFKYAYRQRTSTDNEKLRVLVSSNCGQTWSMRKQVAGSTLSGSMTATGSYSPAPGDWVSYDVTNITSGFLTQGFRFKIEFESDNGNNIYIDDINLITNLGATEIEGEQFSLSVYPNPVNTFANVDFTLPNAGMTEVYITDVLGKTIVVLEKGNKSAGTHSVKINANQIPSQGIYFVTVKSGNTTNTRKFVVH